MKVKVTARTSSGLWVDQVESIFPAGCAELRRTSFLDACEAGGLSREHRLVRVLVADLQFIRPEDVWFRVLAGGTGNGWCTDVEPRLDAALAALRVVDAYACRRTAVPALIEKLIDVPVAIAGRSDNALGEWRQSQFERKADGEVRLDDGAITGHGFARLTPFGVSTAVCASEYKTPEQIVSVAGEFAALEWLSRQLFAWVRGDGRNLGFAASWLRLPPAENEFNAVLSEINAIAERLATWWRDAKSFVDPAWSALLEEQVWNSIRFAAIASSAAEIKKR